MRWQLSWDQTRQNHHLCSIGNNEVYGYINNSSQVIIMHRNNQT